MMTEEEWLTSDDPTPMLRLIEHGMSDRKLRLFSCACCYRYTKVFDDPSTHNAAVLLERYADGLIGESERLYPNTFTHNSLICDMWSRSAYRSARCVTGHILRDVDYQFSDGERRERAVGSELAAQSATLRDIFGNQFRPVTLNPAWLTSDVLALARGIYDERGFDRMPILADAFQDAGCDNDDVLDHCRDANQVHVRGCWVVDLVLGKT